MNQIAITRNTHIHSYKSSVDKHMAYAEQILVQLNVQVDVQLLLKKKISCTPYFDKGENN